MSVIFLIALSCILYRSGGVLLCCICSRSFLARVVDMVYVGGMGCFYDVILYCFCFGHCVGMYDLRPFLSPHLRPGFLCLLHPGLGFSAYCFAILRLSYHSYGTLFIHP